MALLVAGCGRATPAETAPSANDPNAPESVVAGPTRSVMPRPRGQRPAHGIEGLRLTRHFEGADEGWSRDLELRWDGCFRTEEISSDGAEDTTRTCVACAPADGVAALFADVATQLESAPRSDRPPPIVLDPHWRGHLFVAVAGSDERVYGEDATPLAAIARRLHTEGVPGAPALGDDDCSSR